MRITNIMAASLDGQIAAHPDEADDERRRYGFTNDEDYRHLLARIGEAEAVIVGGRSLAATGGVIEVPGRGGRPPLWVVATTRGFAPEALFWRQHAVPRWIVSPAPLPVPPDADVRSLTLPPASLATGIVRALADEGIEHVALLGGGALNRFFYQEGLVSDLVLTVCPLLLAAPHGVSLVQGPLPNPVSLRLVHSQARGDLVFLEYKILHRR